MVSEFTSKSNSVEEMTDNDPDKDNLANNEPEDKDNSESDLQEIQEFLNQTDDVGKIKPLKKRPRMMEVPYSTGHALNKSFNVVVFTCEEEFKIIDYLFRIQKYQNMRSAPATH